MKRNSNVRFMAQLALLVSIVLLMAYTPLGYLKTPWGVEVTFIVIPVAVGSVILGPGAGAFLGLVFGLTSFGQCFGASPLGVLLLQISPAGTFFCCVVTRVAVGLLPGLLYQQGLKRFEKTRTAGVALCCFLTPVLNTAFYITCNWLIFSDTWLDIAITSYGYAGEGGVSLLFFLLAMVAVNGLAEAAACLILGTAVCRALQKSQKRNEVPKAV